MRFGYRAEQRELDVAGLRFRAGNWYVIGVDRLRSEPRTFRVDRIDGTPELLGVSSARLPDDFDVDTVFGRDPWQFGAGEVVEVDIRVDRVVASRVVAELGEDAVVGDDAGGTVVRLSVTDVDALVLWVLDLLDHAVVLGPEPVRDAVIGRLRALASTDGVTR